MLDNNLTPLRSASSLQTRHADAECVKSAHYPQEGVRATRMSPCENSGLCIWACLHSCDEIAGHFLSFDPARKVPSCRKCFSPRLSASQPHSDLYLCSGLFGTGLFVQKYALRSCLVYPLMTAVTLHHWWRKYSFTLPTPNILVWGKNIPFQEYNIDQIKFIMDKNISYSHVTN